MRWFRNLCVLGGEGMRQWLWSGIGCFMNVLSCGSGEQVAAPRTGTEQAETTGTDTDESRDYADARCEPEAIHGEGAALPSWMTVRKGYVYWVEERTQEVRRVPTEGGVPERVASDVSLGWASVVSDEQYLFVPGAEGQIRRIALDGGEDVPMAAFGGDSASALHVRESYVYWRSSTGDPVTGGFNAQVRRVSIDGTEPAKVLWNGRAPMFSSGLAIGGGHLFVGVFNWSYPNGTQADGQVLRVSESTGAAVPLATGLLAPRVEGADDRYVYFTAQTTERYDELWRVAIGGGSPELIQAGTAETSVSVGQLLIQGDTVWWGEANRGAAGLRLFRANARTADVVPLVTLEAHHMLGLAGEDRYLYFSSSHSFDAVGPAAIWRIRQDCSPDG
jgi:hypothetical protein